MPVTEIKAPQAQLIVRSSNGQTIVLSPDDKLVKEVTLECSNPKCAGRNGTRAKFTFNDHDPFPPEGDSFMSLVLPDRSPSNPQFPMPFCGSQCIKDYLTYVYQAPAPRSSVQATVPDATGFSGEGENPTGPRYL